MPRTNDTVKFTLYAPNKLGQGRLTEWELNAFLTDFAFASGRYALDCTRAEYHAMTPTQRTVATQGVGAWSPKTLSLFSPAVSAIVIEGEFHGGLDELKKRAGDAGWGPGVAHYTLDDVGPPMRHVRMIFPLAEATSAANAATVRKAFAAHLGVALREPSTDERYLFPAAFKGAPCEVVLLDGFGPLRMVVE